MSNWGGLDFFIFLILLLNTLLGMGRGANKEIISMLCLCAALIFAIKFTIPLSNFINSSPLITDVISSSFAKGFMGAIGMPPLTADMLFHVGYSISLLICFVGVFSICEAGLAYTNAVEMVSFPYAAANRSLGGSLGFVRGFVIVLIFIVIIQHLFVGNLSNSYFMNLFGGSAQKLDSLITAQAPERYKEILQDKNLYNAEKLLQELKNPT